MTPTLREATPADALSCGTICFEAFRDIAQQHRFKPDYPSAQVATDILAPLIEDERYFTLVAEIDGYILGSIVLDMRDEVVGLGPVTVDVNMQNTGVGKQLLTAALDHVQDRPVRLVQAAYHNRTMAFYTRHGFEVKEMLLAIQGSTKNPSEEGYSVLPGQHSHTEAVTALCSEALGISRAQQWSDAVKTGQAKIIQDQDGALLGFTTELGYSGFSLTQSLATLRTLICSADVLSGQGILLPARYHSLLNWALEQGLRISQPMALMTRGPYSSPTLPYLPSVMY
ncbi:MAG: GNAT family N-acetyltransferase [Bacteroidota bacterium]